MDFQGKKVLVTGSGTGLGRETALEFARRGAEVAFHYAHSKEGAESAVKEVEAQGGKAIAFYADLRETQQAIDLVNRAIEWHGGDLDVLVNNAGTTMTLEFEHVTPEQFDTLYSINVRAQYFAIQTALPVMQKKGKGAIVNLSSIHGFRAYRGH